MMMETNLIAFDSFYDFFGSSSVNIEQGKQWKIIQRSDSRRSLTLNSCSKKLKRLNSHDNSKAVKIGSLEDKAIKLGLASAL